MKTVINHIYAHIINSGEQTVHIWDLYEECLLQTIKIKFPFLGVLGKKVEFGPYCIHPGKKYVHSRLSYLFHMMETTGQILILW